MKRILLTLTAMTLALTACGQNKKEMNTLVAYFSATGTTEAVAKDLAAAYPKINWKAGKTLNGASKTDIKAWVEGLK